jgi:hypothetical protein
MVCCFKKLLSRLTRISGSDLAMLTGVPGTPFDGGVQVAGSGAVELKKTGAVVRLELKKLQFVLRN